MSSPSAPCGLSRFRSVLFLFVIIFTAFRFSISQPAETPRIINFGQTNGNYYRGGQPDLSGFAELKKMGIRSVIDLQEDRLSEEASWVADSGMHYFNIPLSSTHPATVEQTQYFLKLVNDPANWPVYVHCAGGRHRTGEMTAIYRITQDSWDADQAYREMKKYGYYSFPNHGSLKNYVYEYYRTFRSGQKVEPVPSRL